MFLNKLSQRQQLSFLNIAYDIAHSDGEFSISEQSIFKQYCDEMHLDKLPELTAGNIQLGTLAEDFSDKVSQRIVMMELLALIHSDDSFSSSEKQVVANLQQIFQLPDCEITVLSNWARMAISLVQQGNALIES